MEGKGLSPLTTTGFFSGENKTTISRKVSEAGSAGRPDAVGRNSLHDFLQCEDLWRAN